jgi:Lipopolysaccharide-assembly
MPASPPSRTLFVSLGAIALCVLAGCASDGHLHIFGYTTAPTYDCDIRTVYVPIFQNVSFRRGLEFELTRAVVREIEAKTPYKVVNCREQADTELLGKIVGRRKQLINPNQLGETRESEVTMAVELQWNDLRPGHLGEALSRADTAPKDDPAAPLRLDPYAPRPKDLKNPNIILVQPSAQFVPELGGSVVSAEKQLIDRLAVQIVSMMEKW